MEEVKDAFPNIKVVETKNKPSKNPYAKLTNTEYIHEKTADDATIGVVVHDNTQLWTNADPGLLSSICGKVRWKEGVAKTRKVMIPLIKLEPLTLGSRIERLTTKKGIATFVRLTPIQSSEKAQSTPLHEPLSPRSTFKALMSQRRVRASSTEQDVEEAPTQASAEAPMRASAQVHVQDATKRNNSDSITSVHSQSSDDSTAHFHTASSDSDSMQSQSPERLRRQTRASRKSLPDSTQLPAIPSSCDEGIEDGGDFDEDDNKTVKPLSEAETIRPAHEPVSPTIPSGFASASGRRPGAPANYKWPEDRRDSRWAHSDSGWAPRGGPATPDQTASNRRDEPPDSPGDPNTETGSDGHRLHDALWIILVAALLIVSIFEIKIQWKDTFSVSVSPRPFLHIPAYLLGLAFPVLISVFFIEMAYADGKLRQKDVVPRLPTLNRRFFKNLITIVVVLLGQAGGSYIKSSRPLPSLERVRDTFGSVARLVRRAPVADDSSKALWLIMLSYAFVGLLAISMLYGLVRSYSTGAFAIYNPRNWKLSKGTLGRFGLIVMVFLGQALGAYIKSPRFLPSTEDIKSAFKRYAPQSLVRRQIAVEAEVRTKPDSTWSISALVAAVCLALAAFVLGKSAWKALQKRYAWLKTPSSWGKMFDAKSKQAIAYFLAVAEIALVLQLGSLLGRELNIFSGRIVSEVLVPSHLAHFGVPERDVGWSIIQKLVFALLCIFAYVIERTFFQPAITGCCNSLGRVTQRFASLHQLGKALIDRQLGRESTEKTATEIQYEFKVDHVLRQLRAGLDDLWARPIATASAVAAETPVKIYDASPPWLQDVFDSYVFIAVLSWSLAEVPLNRVILFVVMCWYKNLMSWANRGELGGGKGDNDQSKSHETPRSEKPDIERYAGNRRKLKGGG